MKKTIFTGMATALVTPMTPEGIDYDTFGHFIDFQIDSGINALSYLNEILPLEDVELCSAEARLDSANKAVCFASRKFLVGGVPVEITIDWTQPSREKQSVIETEDETLFVSHDTQRIWSGDTLIFEEKVADRLSAHYVNLFASPKLEAQGREAISRRLHEILFCEKEGKV